MKRSWIIALAASLLLTGCASDQVKTEVGAAAGGAADTNSVPAITEIATEDLTIAEGETQPPERLTAPPEIRICTTTEMTASAGFLTKGAFSWYYEDNGAMTSVITDCAVPSEIKTVNISFDPSELIAPPKVPVPVGAKIVKVECWNGTETQNVDFDNNGNILFPAEPIGDTYCVTIEFSEGWGSYGEYGTCDYIFRTISKPVDDTTDDNAGATESIPPVTAQSSAGYNPDEIVQHPGHIVSDPIEKTPEPPELTMSVFFDHSDEQLALPLVQNTFKWKFTDSNGNATETCVDCSAPYQVALKPDFDVADVGKARVELTDDGRLTEVKNWSSEGEWLDVDFQSTGEIYFPQQPIGEIYSVIVEFPEGNSTYVFAASYNSAVEDGGTVSFPGGGELTDYPCEIYRVHDFSDGRMYPEVIVLDSVEELKLYYSENNGNEGFELDRIADELFSKYDNSFFRDNALVFVRLMEGSGSVRHEFIGIDENNNIIIQRVQPEVGTCDMAYYHVAIEIPQSMAGNEFTLITNTLYE